MGGWAVVNTDCSARTCCHVTQKLKALFLSIKAQLFESTGCHQVSERPIEAHIPEVGVEVGTLDSLILACHDNLPK